MTDLTSLGRTVIVLGGVLLVVGVLMTVFGRGLRLPGDILIKRDTVTIYVPIATTIVLSVVLTIMLSLLAKR